MSSTPVDHPDCKTMQVRQGTGLRAMVFVLQIFLALAPLVGVFLLAHFNAGPMWSPDLTSESRRM